MSDLLQMSDQEISRVQVIQQVVKKQLNQRRAARQLCLSMRQVKRLTRAYQCEGPKGLVSKKRGRRSNHQLDASPQVQAVALLRAPYPDFGPTFAHEKLTEDHHLARSVETIRLLMMQAGLWRAPPCPPARDSSLARTTRGLRRIGASRWLPLRWV